jgi:uncharacterized protein YjbI with pentapeptide repeats
MSLGRQQRRLGRDLRDGLSGHVRRSARRGQLTLRPVDLSGSRFEQLSLSDVELSGCNLANVVAQRTRLSRVGARNCRLIGLVVSDAVLRDVTFAGCRIDLWADALGIGRIDR